MFILEREEQFFELLRSWAWRYKRRQLIKVPLPDSPELYDLAIRLCRCSGPYVQEAWAVTRQPEGLFLWLEAPGPNSRNFITALEEKLPGTIDITSCWNWDTPCTA
ncbi:MAG TPA: hypothetical protein PLD93_06495, partial [Synergistaceae bacterium]|nr:hypothetical protein [Synergistaceae bacterium]